MGLESFVVQKERTPAEQMREQVGNSNETVLIGIARREKRPNLSFHTIRHAVSN
jgi:hypothetical protein